MTQHQQQQWTALLSTQRFKVVQGEIKPTHTPATDEGSAGLRSDFHIDHDRVVFSSAFRRLGRKPKYIHSPRTTTPTTASPTAWKWPASGVAWATGWA
jgi:hypothetical protein